MLHGRSTNLLGYDVQIVELFEEGNPRPTRVRMTAENDKNWVIKYYDINTNFYEYMNELLPKFKKAIIDMERELNV
tara:strand:+ start:1274 stop:1501 length:228 start_codon:yes stop_codon:yes gene_type:complete